MLFHQLTTKEKINLLSREFHELDINHDSQLSYQELCTALDKMAYFFNSTKVLTFLIEPGKAI